MDWWVWFVLGAFFMGVELVAIDAAFYLMFIGVAAVLTGLAVLADLPMEIWMQWVLFAVLSITSMLMFRKRLYEKLRGNAPGFDVITGEYLELEADLKAGASCRQAFRGSTWTVKNTGSSLLVKGTSTQVTQISGLTLVVGE